MSGISSKRLKKAGGGRSPSPTDELGEASNSLSLAHRVADHLVLDCEGGGGGGSVESNGLQSPPPATHDRMPNFERDALTLKISRSGRGSKRPSDDLEDSDELVLVDHNAGNLPTSNILSHSLLTPPQKPPQSRRDHYRSSSAILSPSKSKRIDDPEGEEAYSGSTTKSSTVSLGSKRGLEELNSPDVDEEELRGQLERVEVTAGKRRVLHARALFSRHLPKGVDFNSRQAPSLVLARAIHELQLDQKSRRRHMRYRQYKSIFFDIPSNAPVPCDNAPVVSTENQPNPFARLPLEVSLAIMSYLTAPELAKMLLVSSVTSCAAADPVLWRRLCKKAGIDCEEIQVTATCSGVRTPDLDLFPAWWKELGKVEVHRIADPGYSSTSQKRRRRGVMIHELVDKYYPSITRHSSARLDRGKELSWMRVYARQSILRQTWFQKDYTFRRFRGAHRHGITCVQSVKLPRSSSRGFAGAHEEDSFIVTGSWDGLIRVWKLTRGWDDPRDTDDVYDSNDESGSADSMWESGNEDDTISLGELASQFDINLGANNEEGHNRWDEIGGTVRGTRTLSSLRKDSFTRNRGELTLSLEFPLDIGGRIECLKTFGDKFVCGGLGMASLSLWSLTERRRVRNYTHACMFDGWTSQVISCLDTDDITLVSATKSSLFVWDLDTGHLLASVVRPSSNFTTVKISNDGQWVVASCGIGMVSVWEVPTRQTLRSFGISDPHPNLSWNQRLRDVHSMAMLDPQQTSCVNARLLGAIPIPAGLLCSQIRQYKANAFGILCGFKDGNLRGWSISQPSIEGDTSSPGTASTESNSSVSAEEGEGEPITPTTTTSSADASTPNTPVRFGELLVRSVRLLTSLGDWITCLNEESLVHGVTAANHVSTQLPQDNRDSFGHCWPSWSDIIVAGSWDSKVRLWDARTGSLRRTVASSSRSAVLSLDICEAPPASASQLTSSSHVLVTGLYDGGLVLYEFGN